MRQKGFLVLALIGAATFISPPQGRACGHKLAMIGGGVSFERVHQTRHPGNVVLLSAPGRDASPAQQLRRSLERAGHRVRTVADATELRGLVGAGDIDVVLIDLAAVPGDMGPLAKPVSGNGPAVLGVAFGNSGTSDRTGVATRGACVTHADKRRGYEVIDAVDRAVEQRKKGLPAACASVQPTGTI